MGITDQDTAEITVARWLSELPACGEVVALVFDEALAIVVLKAHHDVAAIVGEVVSKHDREGFFFQVPGIHGLAVVGVNFKAFEIVLENHVYGASNCVSAIDGRAADSNGLDALNHGRWNRIQVDLKASRAAAKDGGSIRGDEATAVNQGQGPLGSQSEEVHVAITDAVGILVPFRRAAGGSEGRNLVESVSDVRESALLDEFSIDDHRGLKRVETCSRNPRTGDHDLFNNCVFSEGDLRHRAGASEGAGEGNGADGRRKRVLAKHIGSL